jgi:hypothetical protein
VLRASHKTVALRAIPRALVRTRTGDPFLTMEVLYQLSYEGASKEPSARAKSVGGTLLAVEVVDGVVEAEERT